MNNYSKYRKELKECFRDFGYGWNIHKEKSCDWIINRLSNNTTGIDVGGTFYLVKKALTTFQGLKITYLDLYPPQDPDVHDYIVCDMVDVCDHFPINSLDFITTRHTLEHTTDPLFQLWQYNKILKKQGKLYVILPCYTRNWVWFYSHFNCLPLENWLMLFYRSGFKILEADAGTWNPHNPTFIEYRFALEVECRGFRLDNKEKKAF